MDVITGSSSELSGYIIGLPWGNKIHMSVIEMPVPVPMVLIVLSIVCVDMIISLCPVYGCERSSSTSYGLADRDGTVVSKPHPPHTVTGQHNNSD